MNHSVRPPQCDDKTILDITMNLYLYPAVLIAHRLGIFEFIALHPRSLTDICAQANVERRPAETLVMALLALKLIARDGETFSLTPEAETFLLKSNPHYFGYFWDLMVENSEIFSLKNLESAIRKNTSQVYGEQELFETHTLDADRMRRFTHAMHSLSMGSASVWPTLLPLGACRAALDIGGASGAHAISLTAHWPTLTCTVFDLPEVCPLAADYARHYGLSHRIGTHSGDMWRDPYPAADLHLYSNIFHDWPMDKNRFLAQKSYAALPPGGRIVIHEVLYNDDGDGPPAAAGYSLMMMGWTQGRQYSGREIGDLLRDVGFGPAQVLPSLGYFSIVTAQKPQA
ncbi:TPA: methyltransferase [Serratia marcescens]|uniref:methyltransferase n=1 Tax=Serratia TaxID=613 RepID=UPI00066DD932|nr:methyltransferase [Serratia marcescens]BEN38896.1 O-methyltransferase [Serratia marcescens]